MLELINMRCLRLMMAKFAAEEIGGAVLLPLAAKPYEGRDQRTSKAFVTTCVYVRTLIPLGVLISALIDIVSPVSKLMPAMSN
ncbi:hypothetical protein NeNHUV3_19330 [Nereida sp. NH-UV-3]